MKDFICIKENTYGGRWPKDKMFILLSYFLIILNKLTYSSYH